MNRIVCVFLLLWLCQPAAAAESRASVRTVRRTGIMGCLRNALWMIHSGGEIAGA